MLSRLSPGLESFLCAALKFKSDDLVAHLLSHKWLAPAEKTGNKVPPKVSIKELLKISNEHKLSI